MALNWFRRNGVGNLPKRPLGLLIASMKHRFTDRHRALGSRRRRERPLPEEPHAKGGRSAEGNASAKEELARALRWMKDLPSKQRWPLYYHAFRGLSLEETARALGTTPKAVEKQVAEARRTLRQMYERAGLALPGVARMKKGRRAARKTEPKAKGLRPLRRPRL